MAECAEELRNKVPNVDSCPENDEEIMFIGPASYVTRTWPKLLQCILAAVQSGALPDDVDVVINNDWAGRNYYEVPALNNKRFRLYMDGLRLNSNQWRPLSGGGWELLGGLIQELGQTFSYEHY